MREKSASKPVILKKQKQLKLCLILVFSNHGLEISSKFIQIQADIIEELIGFLFSTSYSDYKIVKLITLIPHRLVTILVDG